MTISGLCIAGPCRSAAALKRRWRALFTSSSWKTRRKNSKRGSKAGPQNSDILAGSCNLQRAQKEYFQAPPALTKEDAQLSYLYGRSRESISMKIIASAIFGRSFFTFGRRRIIRCTSREGSCPQKEIYKHALGRSLQYAYGLYAVQHYNS